MTAYIISGALEGSLLARRKLRFLAASHVTNFCFAVGALRFLAGQPGFALTHVWKIYFGVNMAKCVQFAVALAFSSKSAPGSGQKELEMPWDESDDAPRFAQEPSAVPAGELPP